MGAHNGTQPGFLARVHQRFFYPRRVRRITEHLATMLPTAAMTVQVGAGDGAMAASVRARRRDILLRGVDQQLREGSAIEIDRFDGTTLPYEDKSFHAAVFIDFLHRAEDPLSLMREAMRIAKRWIIVKDYLRNGLISGPLLRAMHSLEESPNGVPLSSYWPEKKWRETFRQLGLEVEEWETELSLYPFPARVLFDRDLHFITRLAVPPSL